MQQMIVAYDKAGNKITEVPAANEQSLRDYFNRQGIGQQVRIVNPEKEAELLRQNQALLKKWNEEKLLKNADNTGLHQQPNQKDGGRSLDTAKPKGNSGKRKSKGS